MHLTKLHNLSNFINYLSITVLKHIHHTIKFSHRHKMKHKTIAEISTCAMNNESTPVVKQKKNRVRRRSKKAKAKKKNCLHNNSTSVKGLDINERCSEIVIPLVSGCDNSQDNSITKQTPIVGEETFQSSQLPGLERYVSVDCEFVGLGPRGRISALGRCSIVDYSGDVILDVYVRPEGTITDYRTRWSGIRPRHMINAVPYHSARNTIRRMLNGKIIVGHSIHNDFKVMKYHPPGLFVRDISRCAQLRALGGFVEGAPVSLKRLVLSFFGEHIQTREHCSIQDAKYTMKLFRLVRTNWEIQLLTKQIHPEQNCAAATSSECISSEPTNSDCTVQRTIVTGSRTRTESMRSSISEPDDCYLQDTFWPDDLHH